MTGDDIAAQLGSLIGGETWEVKHRYEVHRIRKDGEPQDVEVQVNYSSEFGWMVTATDTERDLVATGNPSPDLQATLHTVHWNELEKT